MGCLKTVTHLHHLQLLQPPLHQLLGLPLPKCFIVVLPKGILGPPPGVLAEVVGGELGGLAKKRAVLWDQYRLVSWLALAMSFEWKKRSDAAG